MVEQLRSAGADEIACLLDFGVPEEAVLASLPWLEALRVASEARGRRVEAALAG